MATPLHRTLEQELLALLRGVSLECLVCGEFVHHRADGTIACPECRTEFGPGDTDAPGLQLTVQAG